MGVALDKTLNVGKFCREMADTQELTDRLNTIRLVGPSLRRRNSTSAGIDLFAVMASVQNPSGRIGSVPENGQTRWIALLFWYSYFFRKFVERTLDCIL